MDSCRSVDQETDKRTDFYIEGLVKADEDGLYKIENSEDIFISKDDNVESLNCVSKDRDGCQFNFGYKMSGVKKVQMMISDTRGKLDACLVSLFCENNKITQQKLICGVNLLCN